MPSTPTRANAATLAALATALRAEADAAHAQYAQYANFWDDWRVAEVTKRVRTKLGVAFLPGDLVLVAPTTRREKVPAAGAAQPYEMWPEREFATAYSRRNKCNTGLFAEDIREIEIIEDDDSAGCEGHADGPVMGETFHCDGTCRPRRKA